MPLTKYDQARFFGFKGTEEEFMKEWLASGPLKPSKKDISDALSDYFKMFPIPVAKNGMDGRDGRDGAPGPRGYPGINGAKGDIGPAGDAPAHRWDGTRLSFQNPDGSWGESFDIAVVIAKLVGNNSSGGGGGSIRLHEFSAAGVSGFVSKGKPSVTYFDTSTTPIQPYVYVGTQYLPVGGSSVAEIAEHLDVADALPVTATSPNTSFFVVYLKAMTSDVDLTGWVPLNLTSNAIVQVVKEDDTPYKVVFTDHNGNLQDFVNRRTEYATFRLTNGVMIPV